MNILILWASLADYTVACFRQLANKPNVNMMLVFQSVNGIAPFDNFDLSFCQDALEDKNINFKFLSLKCFDFHPDLVLMASWNYKHYMKISKRCKEDGSVIISSFDNQWKSSIRQNVARLISPIYLKPVIDNFLVPGDRQAQLSYHLGYKQPFYGLYCANSNNFNNARYNSYAKKFLFIGRLIEQKGLRILLESYEKYRNIVSDPWELYIVGEGPLKINCQNRDGVSVKSFVQPSLLCGLFSVSSCFVLPSLHENWGLVIHEAALAGLPIISSSQCGATTWFLRDGKNGYLVEPEIPNLTNALIKISKKSIGELETMSEISKTLGNLWTLDNWADIVFENFQNSIANQ